MGIGIITNPVVVIFALLVLLERIGIWHGNLAIPSILIVIFYSILTFLSTQW